jgi:hypothetical protein
VGARIGEGGVRTQIAGMLLKGHDPADPFAPQGLRNGMIDLTVPKHFDWAGVAVGIDRVR